MKEYFMEMISGVKETNEMSNRRIGKGIPLTIIAMLLLLGMMVTIAGCSKGSALVGKWEYLEDGISSGAYIEFLSDGTINFEGIKLEWKIEKGQLMLSAYGQTEAYATDYKISGSTLTMINFPFDGQESQFKKVKK